MKLSNLTAKMGTGALTRWEAFGIALAAIWCIVATILTLKGV